MNYTGCHILQIDDICFSFIRVTCNAMLSCFPFHIPLSYHTDETLQCAKFNETNPQKRIHSCITPEHCKNTPQIHVSWFCLRYLNTPYRFFGHNHLKKPYPVYCCTMRSSFKVFICLFKKLYHIQNSFSFLHSSEHCISLSLQNNRESLRKNLLWTN